MLCTLCAPTQIFRKNRTKPHAFKKGTVINMKNSRCKFINKKEKTAEIPMQNSAQRAMYGKRMGIFGILSNLVLFAVKLIAGILHPAFPWRQTH